MAAARNVMLVAAAAVTLSVGIGLVRNRPVRDHLPPAGIVSPAGQDARSLRDAPPRLEDWVAAAPDDACAWVLGRPAAERLGAATALLIAAADHPGLAERLAARLCAEDAGFVRDHGNTLIAVLGAHGRFDAALAFARMGGPEHGEWTERVLTGWARQNPEAAVRAALALPGHEGLPPAAAVWAERDPAALADFAVDTLRGPARTLALTAALPAWMEREPSAVAAWLDRFEPNAELDSSFAALALLPAMIARFPDVAFEWAGLIVDPDLRYRTQASLLRAWARTDHTAAERQLAGAPAFGDEERARLRTELEAPVDPR